jgi:hypothetical protein
MILRLRTNKMALHGRKHQLSLRQRQPDHPRSLFGHRGTAADLMNANGPIRSGQFQHNPPLHPELTGPTPRLFNSTPRFWTVSAVSGVQKA